MHIFLIIFLFCPSRLIVSIDGSWLTEDRYILEIINTYSHRHGSHNRINFPANNTKIISITIFPLKYPIIHVMPMYKRRLGFYVLKAYHSATRFEVLIVDPELGENYFRTDLVKMTTGWLRCFHCPFLKLWHSRIVSRFEADNYFIVYIGELGKTSDTPSHFFKMQWILRWKYLWKIGLRPLQVGHQ